MGMTQAWAWHRHGHGTDAQARHQGKDKTWERYWRGTDKAQVYGHNTGTGKQGTCFYCTPSLNKDILFYSRHVKARHRQGSSIGTAQAWHMQGTGKEFFASSMVILTILVGLA